MKLGVEYAHIKSIGYGYFRYFMNALYASIFLHDACLWIWSAWVLYDDLVAVVLPACTVENIPELENNLKDFSKNVKRVSDAFKISNITSALCACTFSLMSGGLLQILWVLYEDAVNSDSDLKPEQLFFLSHEIATLLLMLVFFAGSLFLKICICGLFNDKVQNAVITKVLHLWAQQNHHVEGDSSDPLEKDLIRAFHSFPLDHNAQLLYGGFSLGSEKALALASLIMYLISQLSKIIPANAY